MNELTRYRIKLGPRCMFDNNTFMNFSGINNDDLIMNLCYYEDPISEELHIRIPEKLDVTPNQKLNIYGIYITVPSDATKMIKWSSDSIKSALLLFLKSDTEPVNNAFIYQICMDNWIEIGLESDIN